MARTTPPSCVVVGSPSCRVTATRTARAAEIGTPNSSCLARSSSNVCPRCRESQSCIRGRSLGPSTSIRMPSNMHRLTATHSRLFAPTLFGKDFTRIDSLGLWALHAWIWRPYPNGIFQNYNRSEEHTSELQSPCNLVCRLLLEKKKKTNVIAVFIEETAR